MAKVTKQELQDAFDTVIRFFDEYEILSKKERRKMGLIMSLYTIIAEDEQDERS